MFHILKKNNLLGDNKLIDNDNFIQQIHFWGKDLLLFKYKNFEIIDASDISKCLRYLVLSKINSKQKMLTHKEKIDILFNNYLKNIWLNILKEKENIYIEGRDLQFYDYILNIKCNVDALIRIGGCPFVFLFKYIKQKNIKNIKNKLIPKKDLIEINCCMLLANVYDGIIVYQHNDPIIYHIQKEQKICDAIIDKCRKINEMSVLKKIPSLCRKYNNKICYQYCKNN